MSNFSLDETVQSDICEAIFNAHNMLHGTENVLLIGEEDFITVVTKPNWDHWNIIVGGVTIGRWSK